jgi:FkbM family methyltransferase
VKPAPIDPPVIWPTLWQGAEGTVGWDVGANCGQTIPQMLERFDRVIAFEPARECWPYLDKLAQDGLTIKHIGLSDKDGSVDLIALPDKIDTGQLVTTGTHGMEWDPDADSGLIRSVPCRTVDGFTRDEPDSNPDFMKIDVEGHEMRILKGAKRTLALDHPDLLIEFHSPELYDEIISFLDGFGYATTTVRHPHYPEGSLMFRQHGWIKARLNDNR